MCNVVQVPIGEYRLSALAAKPEIASGLMFLPSYIDVAVWSPLLNVEFSQVILKNRQTLSSPHNNTNYVCFGF